MAAQSIIGNWKLNGNRSMINEVLRELLDAKLGAHVALCLPFTYLDQACQLLRDSAIKVGSQDVSRYQEGAYTGEVSASMVKDMGCSLTLIGHSERRAYFAEISDVLQYKVTQALASDLKVVFCVGENLAVRQSGRAVEYVLNELDVLRAIDPSKFVVAYEPVWAIGTGASATLEEIGVMHQAIKASLGEEVSVLYGGSVKANNAKSILSVSGVDGLLVGGASLNAKEFIAISNSGNQ